MRLVRIAAGKRNFYQREILVPQEYFRLLDPQYLQVLIRRDLCGPAEALEETGAAHAEGGGKLGDLETALQMICLLYTSPSPRDQRGSRMPSSA